ncbi:MAG: zf-TFIIB domain-containing protein [Polyangiaceae bacterium]
MTGAMEGALCPRCAEPLDVFSRPTRDEARAVEIAMCLRCGGLWMEQGALTQAFPEVIPFLAARQTPDREHPCPTCAKPLAPVFVDRLELDTCGECGGLWVDADEIQPLEDARPTLAATEVMVSATGYRTTAQTASASVPCEGCGRPMPIGGEANQVYCSVCADAIANPIEPPVGLGGRLRRFLRGLFVKPCPLCGSYVCKHEERRHLT